MSLDPPIRDHDDIQSATRITALGFSDHESTNHPQHEHVLSTNPEKSRPTTTTTTLQSDVSHHYLEAPSFPRQSRPLSPDALSNLSLQENAQLRPRSLSPGPYLRRGSIPDDEGFAGFTKSRQRRRSWRSKVKGVWVRNLGLLYMLVAMLFGSLMNVTTRTLEIEGNEGKGIHPFQILFARMSITCVLAMIYMWWKQTPHFPFGDPAVRWLLVARGVGGFFGVFGMYSSLLYLPMADATVITFLAPSLSCYACSLLINEPFTRTEKYGSLVAFIGVIFISRPASLFSSSAPSSAGLPPTSDTPFPNPTNSSSSSSTLPGANSPGDASNYNNVTPAERLFAVGIALVGVFGSVCAFTTIRWIGKRAHPLISVNYFAVWCTIVSTGAMLLLPDVGGFLLPKGGREWGMLVFLGTCGFIMQFLLAAGLSYEKSSRATNMTYTSMLYALAFDKFVFGQTPGVWSIVGSTLILGSAVWMAVHRDAVVSGSGAGSAAAAAVVEEGVEREGSGLAGDEEEGVGLMADMEDGAGAGRGGVDEDDVEMRRLS